MRIPSKFIRPISVFLLAILAVSLWSALLSVSVVNADPTTPSSSSSSPLAAPPVDDPDNEDKEEPPVGEACGAGELLPAWVICLHGNVSPLDDHTGAFAALDGIPITVTYGGESITTTTFVHPGDLTPTFSVDISPLKPHLLQPVTLTAVVSNTTIQRIVPLLPDLETRSQRVDISLANNTAFPPASWSLWGVVMDYGKDDPATGAVVNAEYDGRIFTATTTLHPSQTQAIYTFSQLDLKAIGANSGDVITLTAHYAGDADQRVVTVPSTPRQLNFVTGWRCDNFDPLTDDVWGMGQTSGGFALPDVSCFWGYGLVDGVPTAGMSVHMEISGTIIQGETALYAGEERPRYGIPVVGLDTTTEQVLTITGVYSGFVTSQVVTVTLDDADSQRVDLALAEAGFLTRFNVNDVGALAWHNKQLWAGTSSGVIRWDPNGSDIEFTSADGLVNNDVQAVAVYEQEVLFGTMNGLSRYNPNTDTWRSVGGLENQNMWAITVDGNNNIWFGTSEGAIRRDSNGGWQTFTTANGLINNEVRAIAANSNNEIWFGTSDGVSRYTPLNETWQSFTTSDGLGDNNVRAIAIDKMEHIWFGTQNGVSRYIPSDNTWHNFTTTDGLVNNDVLAIAIDDKQNMWFGTTGGLSRYYPSRHTWESFTTTDGLADNEVSTIILDDEQNLWFGTDRGISQWGVQPQSDLLVELNGPAIALPNRPFTYTLQIMNQGQYTATDYHLTVTLPVSATPLISSGSMAPNSHSLLVVTATLDRNVAPNSNVTAVADIATNAPESFFSNNKAKTTTFVRDARPDARVNLMGPPVLSAGSKAVYQIRADNWGGSDATNSRLTVTLPNKLTYHQADLPPTSLSPLSWDLGTLAASAQPAPTNIMLTVTVDSSVTASTTLPVFANVTTMTDSNLINNQAAITVSTSLNDRLTLILVAPDRLAARYGATPVLSRLYDLADHDKVRGVVVDIERDADVQAAYAAWDNDSSNWTKANAVATAIKDLIDDYTISHPNLEYLVFVGGDDMVPFYRVADQSATFWSEHKYAQHVPAGTIHGALMANRLLTDDFYADRTPTLPTSAFWYGGQSLYLPDFASGRLVETPDEINAAIDAFLANDGLIELGPAIVGTHDHLTDDLGTNQCDALQAVDVGTNICTEKPADLRQEVLKEDNSFGSIWAAIHSNHFSMGPLTANDIKQRTDPYSQTLLVTIGCHAGLNVPAASSSHHSLPDFDLVQAFLLQRGTVIGTSAFGYASDLSVGYSEALSEKLTRLLSDQTSTPSTLGTALIEAKQHYFTTRPAFDYLDEKVLLPVTLYGLPMLQVTTANRVPARSLAAPPPAQASNRAQSGALTVVTYTLSSPTYTSHKLKDGVYYDLDGETIAQHGYPIQPSHEVPLAATIEGQTPHGVILRSAAYTETEDFDPVIAQAWAISEKASPQAEPAATITGWDRKLPYTLGLFDGLVDTQASLNLVLGAYHTEEATERLYQELTLEVLYTPLTDRVAPSINFATAHEEAGAIQLQVKAQDDNQIIEVIGVCDDGVGNWSTVSLTSSESENDLWEGTCQSAERFYVQVVDEAGNVAINEWQSASPTTIPLVAGWNLLSIPVQPTNTNITEVFASIAGNYDLVYAYDVCDAANTWKKYDPSAPPFANDLTDVGFGAGLWVRMTSPDTLEVSGTEPLSSSIPLCAGWNLTGYPSSQPLLVADAIATIEGTLSLLYGYEATDSGDPWQKYDPSAQPFANDLEVMQPKRGYWIKVNQDTEWLINN